MYIVHADTSSGTTVVYEVPEGKTSEQVAESLGLESGSWREAFNEEIEDLQRPFPEEILEEEARNKARIASASILATRMQRSLAQSEDFSPQEFVTFARAGLYDEWKPDEDYFAGLRLVHEGIVYRVEQEHASQAHQQPGSTGMLAIYKPISVEGEAVANGSLEAPFTLLVGMEGMAGKHYLWSGRIYKCLRHMSNILEGWVPGSPGMDSFWELVG